MPSSAVTFRNGRLRRWLAVGLALGLSLTPSLMWAQGPRRSRPALADPRLGVTMVNVPAPHELGPHEPRTPLVRRLELWKQLCDGAEPSYIQDQLYVPSADVTECRTVFQQWHARWKNYPHKERLELNLPLFPARDLTRGGADFALQADRFERLLAGEFDAVFDALAEWLIAAGYGRAQLRLAHEFNQLNPSEVEDYLTGALTLGGRFPHLVNPESETNIRHFCDAWVHVWTRFMKKNGRARSGARFQWVWSPLVGDPSWDVTGQLPFTIREGTSDEAQVTASCYPGDAYVDIIGVDFYEGGGQFFYDAFHPDGTQAVSEERLALKRELAWRKAVEGKVYSEDSPPHLLQDNYPGLNHYYTFAEKRGKAFRLSEWGISAKVFPNIPGLDPPGTLVDPGMTSGDNPGFIARVYQWLKAHPRATSACYFEGPVMPWEQSDHSLLDYGWGVANPQSRARFVELFVKQGFTSR